MSAAKLTLSSEILSSERVRRLLNPRWAIAEELVDPNSEELLVKDDDRERIPHDETYNHVFYPQESDAELQEQPQRSLSHAKLRCRRRRGRRHHPLISSLPLVIHRTF
jgi:hypothetical protein